MAQQSVPAEGPEAREVTEQLHIANELLTLILLGVGLLLVLFIAWNNPLN